MGITTLIMFEVLQNLANGHAEWKNRPRWLVFVFCVWLFDTSVPNGSKLIINLLYRLLEYP